MSNYLIKKKESLLLCSSKIPTDVVIIPAGYHINTGVSVQFDDSISCKFELTEAFSLTTSNQYVFGAANSTRNVYFGLNITNDGRLRFYRGWYNTQMVYSTEVVKSGTAYETLSQYVESSGKFEGYLNGKRLGAASVMATVLDMPYYLGALNFIQGSNLPNVTAQPLRSGLKIMQFKVENSDGIRCDFKPYLVGGEKVLIDDISGKTAPITPN